MSEDKFAKDLKKMIGPFNSANVGGSCILFSQRPGGENPIYQINAAHEAAKDKAVGEFRERACRAVCSICKEEGIPSKEHGDWVHKYVDTVTTCRANDIRSLPLKEG